MLPKPSVEMDGIELSAFRLYILIENQGVPSGFMDDILIKLKEDK